MRADELREELRELEVKAAAVRGAVADEAIAAIERYRNGECRDREIFSVLRSLFAETNDTAVRLLADEIAGGSEQASLAERSASENGQASNWIKISSGNFLMGAQKRNRKEPNYDAEAYDDESPVRRVFLSGYWIGRYPVTVEEYRRFVEDGGYGEALYWRAGGFGRWKEPGSWREQLDHVNPTRPVVEVSWYEATAYAAWMAARRRVYGCRLPTEAEWEKAARGTTGRKYPWGNTLPNEMLANFAPDGKPNVGHLTPVGAYPPGNTPEGVSDMAGNVWEWCGDVLGPARNAEGVVRVLRGGSWFNHSGYLRSAYRFVDRPGARFDYIGFRVVCVLSPRTSL